MGLRERLCRLERETERANAATSVRYLAAIRRETVWRLHGVYDRLARIPGDNGPSTPHPRHDRELLADDTSERAEADRLVVGDWERAQGTSDIKGAADAARARSLDTR